MVKGQENLIPVTKRTKAEQRQIAIMGGKASGVARRNKKTAIELMKLMLANPAPKKHIDELKKIFPNLEAEDITIKTMLISKLFHNGLKGKSNDIMGILETVGEVDKTQKIDMTSSDGSMSNPQKLVVEFVDFSKDKKEK